MVGIRPAAAHTTSPIDFVYPASTRTKSVGGTLPQAPNRTMSNSHTNTPFRHPVVEKVALAWPPHKWTNTHVLLAISGGADSVALTRAVWHLKQQSGGDGRVFVAHFNHRLRGETADRDQAMVATLCQQLGLPFHTGQPQQPLDEQATDGVEAAARQARYEFLGHTAQQIGARLVATGHTSNDQAETVLHRLLRGTGVAGLAGIRFTRPLVPDISLVRPLLRAWRVEIEDYLSALGQTYCTDPTNTDPRFTRNRLRHDLLPKLRRDYNERVDRSLVRLAEQATEAQAFVDAAVHGLVEDCVTVNPTKEQVVIHGKALREQPMLISRELCKRVWTTNGWPLQAMGFDQWQKLARMAVADLKSWSINLPGEIRAERCGEQLVLTRQR